MNMFRCGAWSFLRVSFSLFAFLCVVGCGPKAPPIDFATAPVATLQARINHDSPLGPGKRASLVVTLTAPDGSSWQTDASGSRKLPWSSLALTPTLVTVNAKGQITLPQDPRQIGGDMGRVTVTIPGHPGVHTEIDVPLRFDLRYTANHSGAQGINGFDGSNGLDGARGADGSFDPAHQTPGSNGSDGSNGKDGSDGQQGGNGSDVQIRLAMHPGGHLIEAEVTATWTDTRYFLIDPNGGSLSVSTNGGSGGKGGTGGRGGHGGTGGAGWPPGLSGHDGLNGQDGHDGLPGNGGHITVIYDPSVQPYLPLLHLSCSHGPSPRMVSASTRPLW